MRKNIAKKLRGLNFFSRKIRGAKKNAFDRKNALSGYSYIDDVIIKSMRFLINVQL